MEKIYRFFSSGFYSGFLPGVPGTWGSLSFILIWWLLKSFTLVSDLSIIAVTIVLAIISTSKTLEALPKDSKSKDPGFIVIDEWVGMAVSLIGVSATSYVNIGVAFFLFRVLDVLKPGPIGSSEKLPGALGVIADDFFAGAVVAFLMGVFLL